VLMQEVDAGSCLNKVVKGFIFLKDTLRLYNSEKVATSNIFHDQVNVMLVFEHGVKSDDVLMFELAVYAYLALQRFSDFFALQTKFFDLLNS